MKYTITVSSVLLKWCTQLMQGSGILTTCLSKQALNCFREFVREFIFLFLHVFNSQTEASIILLIFFEKKFKILSIFWRSCRLAFSWRFKFSYFTFVMCCWGIARVEITFSNRFLYSCIIFWNSDWIKTFIFPVSSWLWRIWICLVSCKSSY